MRLRYFIFLFACSISLSGCDYIFASRWNYRITVSVDTPEGVKTGSAVRMVTAKRQVPITPEVHPVKYDVHGEAVVVDLGNRGQLFALISWGSFYEVEAALPSSLKGGRVEEMRYYRKLAPGTKGMLPRESYPKLVTFANLNEPKSVKAVDPDAPSDTFGEGVTLREITIEITNEPVTWGIVDQYLPSSYHKVIIEGWRQLSREEKHRLVTLTTFKRGK